MGRSDTYFRALNIVQFWTVVLLCVLRNSQAIAFIFVVCVCSSTMLLKVLKCHTKYEVKLILAIRFCSTILSLPCSVYLVVLTFRCLWIFVHTALHNRHQRRSTYPFCLPWQRASSRCSTSYFMPLELVDTRPNAQLEAASHFGVMSMVSFFLCFVLFSYVVEYLCVYIIPLLL